MRLIRTFVLSSLALGAGTAALSHTSIGTTAFVVPTSIAAVQQDADAVCERVPSTAAQVGVPAIADRLASGCNGAVQTVNRRLDTVIGDGGTALTVPDDGRPILVRVAAMAEGIGGRLRNVR